MPDTNIENTAFATHLVTVLGRHGKTVSEEVTATLELQSPKRYLEIRFWQQLFDDLNQALKTSLPDQTEQAVLMLAEIIQPVTPGAFYCFGELVFYLDGHKTLSRLTPQLISSQAGRSILPTLLFTCLFDGRGERLVSDTVSQLVGSTVDFPEPALGRQLKLAGILFGPAWTELYASTQLTDEQIVTHVLHLQPPLIGFNRDIITAPVTLPDMAL